MDRNQFLFRGAMAAFVAAWLAGCDKVPSLEDAKKSVTGAVDQATQVVENTNETVKQATGAAGSIQLQLDAPVTSSGCYPMLYVFSDGRPSVLQITSYNDPTAESFPSLILRAETKAKSSAELSGQKLSAKAFVQENKDGPVWQAIDKPLELTISAADEKTITALFSGSFENVEDGKSKETTGTLSGSFPIK